MMLQTPFNLGDVVYLKTDDDQKKRMITCISFRQSGVLFELSCGVNVSSHYDFEISLEKDIVLTTTN